MKKTVNILMGIIMVLTICAGFTWADNSDTSVGYESGTGGTNAQDTYIGYLAGYNGNSGTSNTSVGAYADWNGGTSNTSVGDTAGYNGGTSNTSVGGSAGYNGGSYNSSFGGSAGYNGGSYNASLGNEAGGNQGGSYNTSVGASAGYNGGSYNSSFGAYAGYHSTGTGNVFLGYLAGYSETGSNKLYIDNCLSGQPCESPFIQGDFSAKTLTVDGQVTATYGFVGNGSGLTNINAATCTTATNATNATTVTNGVYTTGSYANPSWITSLSGSIITGTVSNATNATNATNSTTVSNGVYTTGTYADPGWISALSGTKITGTVANATNAVSCTVATFATDASTATTASTSTSTAQIGTITINYIPRWNGSQLISGIISDNGSTASVNGTLSVTALVSLSDERYKRNIEPLQQSLDKVTHLTGVSYEWKTDEYSGKGFKEGRQIGLIAQDVEKVFPELVLTDDKGYKAVAYDKLVSVLIEAVKEQQKTIADKSKVVDEQQNAINELKEEMAKLATEVNKLKSKDMSAQK
jgi:trimeric autotransporter adhesin